VFNQINYYSHNVLLSVAVRRPILTR
jgi:hypothetical protein